MVGILRTLLTRLTLVGVVLGLLTIGLVGAWAWRMPPLRAPAHGFSVSCGNVATALDTQYGDTSWAYLADEPIGDTCSAPPGVIVGGLEHLELLHRHVRLDLPGHRQPGGQTNAPNAANLWACQVVGGGPIILISAGAFNTMCAQQDDPNSLSWAIDPNDAYTINCYVPYGTVAGQVTDGTTGNGIPSVCVQIITPTGKVVTSVAANAIGRLPRCAQGRLLQADWFRPRVCARRACRHLSGAVHRTSTSWRPTRRH